jgi:hypothetical protein
MPSWNDTFTEHDDWSHVSFITMFFEALKERFTAFSGFLTVHLPAVGADVSACTQFEPASATGSFSIRYLQMSIESLCENFFPNKTFNGVSWINRSPDFTGEDILSGNGTSVGNWTLTDFRAAAGLNASGFIRKFPREFLNASSTFYVGGGAFSDGHVARRVDNGKIYTRTAGAWVETLGVAPDVLTAFGIQSPGDYIGPWCWTELRDCFNLMVWRRAADNNSLGSYEDKQSTSFSRFDNYDDAIADAVASFNDNSNTPVFGTPHGDIDSYAEMQGTEEEPSFWVRLGVRAPTYVINGLPTTIAKDIHWFTRAVAWGDGGHTQVFDDNGDPVQEELNVLWRTDSSSTDATVTTPQFRPLTAPNLPPEPTLTNWYRYGYILNPRSPGGSSGMQVLLCYDVSGGFQYTAAA